MPVKALHPGQFVIIFRTRRRIAIGQIDRGDPHRTALRRNHDFQIACLFILIIAGQAGLHFLDRIFRKDGDAVIGLLPVGLDIIAKRLDLQPREALIDRLDLLQAGHVGLGLFQPVQNIGQARLDRIDVPGSNCQGHGEVFMAAWRATA